MSSKIIALEAKIIELENKLELLSNNKNVSRIKIAQMSSKVVDSNPYRFT